MTAGRRPLITMIVLVAMMLFWLAASGKAWAVEGGRQVGIENGGFETLQANPAPALNAAVPSWLWFGVPPKPKDRPELSSDAWKGKRAVLIKAGGLFQRVRITAEDRAAQKMTLRFHAKGRGRLRVWIKVLDASGKDLSGWAPIQKSVALVNEYVPYSIEVPRLPEKCKLLWVSLSISNGRAWVDGISMGEGGPPATEPSPTAKVPADVKLVNIARLAKIRTYPYTTLVRRMVDGVNSTGASAYGVGIGQAHSSDTYEFIFDQPREVAKIRISMPSEAFGLWADTTGGGRYDKLLRLESAYPHVHYWRAKKWPYYEASFWPPVKVHAIKLVNFAAKNNPVMEFQVLAPADSVDPQVLQAPSPVDGVPTLSLGAPVTVAPPSPAESYTQGFCIESWMYGCPAWLKKNPRPALKDWPAFQTMVRQIKEMHGNVAAVFPPRTSVRVKGRPKISPYMSDVLWPSKYEMYSSPENLLKELTDALHAEGITVYVWPRQALIKNLKRPAGVEETPVIPWAYRKGFQGIAAEVTASGVDGAPLCNDEAFFPGMLSVTSSSFPKSMATWPGPTLGGNHPWVKKAFMKRWKVNKFPAKFTDDELTRKWVLFWYEQVADFMNQNALAAKKVNPNVTTLVHMGPAESYRNRLERGIAYDVIGHNADIDLLGTDPYHTREDGDMGVFHSSAETKRLIAGNRKRESMVVLNFPWGIEGPEKQPLTFEVCPPISTIGQVIGSAMNGGHTFIFWRLNFAKHYGRTKAVTQAFGITRTMAAWGGREATVPKDIAVLSSRASEDWWEIKSLYGDGDPADQDRGFVYDQWLQEFLLTHGYPYAMYYLDQPEDYADLSQYKLVILPFPYSMPRKGFDEIAAAIQAGTKVLVLGARGETNKFGTAYDKPLLEKWIQNGQVAFIGDDLPRVAHFPSFVAKVKQRIDSLLGGNKTLSVKTNGYNVEASCLITKDGNMIVPLINWDDRDAIIDLGLRLPDRPGGYQVLLRDLDETRRVTIDGRSRLTAKDLARFRVKMDKDSVNVLYVAKAD